MSPKLDSIDRGIDHVSPDYQKADPDLEYSNIGDTGKLLQRRKDSWKLATPANNIQKQKSSKLDLSST